MFKIIFLILFFSVNLFSKDFKMLLNPGEILKNNYVIVDARSEFSFIKGHIKGAIHLDGGCSGKICHKVKNLPCVLKPLPQIISILKNKGICPNKKIVIYGDQDNWGAEGRIYWLLDKLGYKNIAILNGGFYLWKERGYPISYGFSFFPKRNSCNNIKYKNFKLITADDIFRLMKEKKAIIIDTRTLKEYKGATLYGEKRGGHIPGAILIHWKNFLNSNYTMKSKEEILNILKNKGIPGPKKCNKKIITICTGGVRSGFVYFVLKYVGYKNVENYDYGFWQWALSKYPIKK